jgi:hypothetical protein
LLEAARTTDAPLARTFQQIPSVAVVIKCIHRAVINLEAYCNPTGPVVELGNDGFGGLLQRVMFDLDDR